MDKEKEIIKPIIAGSFVKLKLPGGLIMGVTNSYDLFDPPRKDNLLKCCYINSNDEIATKRIPIGLLVGIPASEIQSQEELNDLTDEELIKEVRRMSKNLKTYSFI